MEQVWANMSEIIVTAFFAIVTPYVISFLRKMAEQARLKTENDDIDFWITKAENVVTTAVATVNQVVVDAAKKNGKFTEEVAKQAFDEAKAKAIVLISENAKESIETVHNNFEDWLNDKIEENVSKLKTTYLQSATLTAGVSDISPKTAETVPSLEECERALDSFTEGIGTTTVSPAATEEEISQPVEDIENNMDIKEDELEKTTEE